MQDEKSAAKFHYIKTVGGKVLAQSIGFVVDFEVNMQPWCLRFVVFKVLLLDLHVQPFVNFVGMCVGLFEFIELPECVLKCLQQVCAISSSLRRCLLHGNLHLGLFGLWNIGYSTVDHTSSTIYRRLYFPPVLAPRESIQSMTESQECKKTPKLAGWYTSSRGYVCVCDKILST